MRILLSLCLIIALGSCAGGWTEEDKKLFRQDCISSVGSQLGEAQKNKYCECFTEQMVSIYPVFNDAMEHRDSAKLEEAKAHCRKEIGLD
jgi:hypothetical protein